MDLICCGFMIDQSKKFRQIASQFLNIWDILIPKLPLFALIFFLAVLFYSVFSLIRSSTPTLYVLTFSVSLFSCGGIFYYLYINKNLDSDTAINANPINANPIYFKIILIIFVLSIAFILFILHNVYYVKPSEYYVLIGIAAVSISLQIGLKKEVSNKEAFIIFLQIFALATVINASSLFLSPFHTGVDSHQFHYPQILKIIQTGHLDQSAFHYFYYPCFHLMQSIAGLIIGFSITSFKLINLCNSLVLLPVGYLIGSHVHDKKSGLMCALLFALSTMNIFIVLFSNSKVGGATLLILDLYLLLKMLHSANVKYLLLFFICTLSLFLWHPEISAALLFILLAYSFTKIVNYQNLKLDSLLLLYLIFHVSYNMYVSTHLFEIIVKSVLFIDVSHDSELIQNFVGNSTGMDLMFQLFAAYLGISIPFFFVIYAFFSWIQKGNLNNRFLMLSFFAVCLIPVVGVFSTNMSLSPARLLTYVSLISLIITSTVIFNVFTFKTKISVFLFTAIILLFSIFSSSSYLGADGSELYNDKIPICVIFTTHSNVASNEFINSRLPSNVEIISDTATVSLSEINRKTKRFTDLNSTGYILINNYHIKRLNLVLDNYVTISNKNKIYTNFFNNILSPSS
jgi:hypothetical protein